MAQLVSETPTGRREPIDAELVPRAQHGDRAAFATLYERHAPAVARLAASRASWADADDAVAETFARAWSSIGRYRDTGVPFVAWLFGIARNVIADGHRRASRLRTTPELPEASTDPTDAQAALLDLGAAISELNSRQRRVIELKYFAGLTNEEVARALRLTPGAVNTLQWRALRRLQSIMEAP